MIFHIEMQKGLDSYEKKFCSALNEWFESDYKSNHPKGAVSSCAKWMGISQGHFSSILKGQKCWRSEHERRLVAEKIGKKYEDMIGIEQPTEHCSDQQSAYTSTKNNVIKIERDHIELVKGFKDKPTAKAINQQLKRLEDANHGAFASMETYIGSLADYYEGALSTSEQQDNEIENLKLDSPLKMEKLYFEQVRMNKELQMQIGDLREEIGRLKERLKFFEGQESPRSGDHGPR